MTIELTPKKIIPGAFTIWTEHGPEVDLACDLKNINLKPGSVDKIYAFHVVDRLFADEAQAALKNWYKLLAPGGQLIVVVDDFEYLARAFVGGDIKVDYFNEHHSAPTYFTRDNLAAHLTVAGFAEDKVVIWYDPEFIKAKPFELTLGGTK